MKSKRGIKAVIFDLDNTLVDFWTFKNKCIDAAIGAMIKAGLKMKKNEMKGAIWELHKELGMEHKYVFQAFLKRKLGKVDYRLLAYALTAYRNARAGIINAYPGVKQTIKKLRKRGYKTAIISDAPRQKAWLRLVLTGIDDLFDVVVAFEDTKKKKPHKLPFQTVLKKLNVKAGEVLLVGDSIHKDMAGAKSVGMNTVLALYGRTLKPGKNPKGADFMIKRADDLLKIV